MIHFRENQLGICQLLRGLSRDLQEVNEAVEPYHPLLNKEQGQMSFSHQVVLLLRLFRGFFIFVQLFSAHLENDQV